VLVLIAILLAIFVLPSPWGLVAIIGAAIIDLTEVSAGLWWNRRQKAKVGVQTLVGRTAVAIDALVPDGQVKLDGELWRARCLAGCDRGAEVVVVEVDGLTLEVEPV
jgi:membrane protein implicated in regulation of membrane protease activity